MLDTSHRELKDYIISAFGLQYWEEVELVARLADTSSPASSSSPKAGPDNALLLIVAAACQVTGADQHQLLAGFGRYLVNSLNDQGYGRVRATFGQVQQLGLGRLDEQEHVRAGLKQPTVR